MAPVVHGLEAEYDTQMSFIFLDVDDPQVNEFKSALGFRYQPHFFLLDGEGNRIKQWIGAVSEAELEAAFIKAIEE